MARGAQAGGGGYSVGAVVRLTGLSEHLLRAWERRYGAIEPSRTPGGSRRYSEADVERLRILQSGVEAGHPISELAELANEEIERRVRAVPRPEPAPLEAVFEAVGRLDASELERLLGIHFGALGPGSFAREIARPLLERIGEAWQRGDLSVASEHLASAQLRSILGMAVRSPTRSAPRAPIVFATPSGERHELGLMIAALVAVGAGARAVYLGPDLPADEIAGAAAELGARVVALSVIALSPGEARRQLRQLRQRLDPGIPIWVGGAASASLALPPGAERLDPVDVLERRISRLG